MSETAPRSFESWAYAAALDLSTRDPSLEPGAPGTFSEAVAYLTSRHALAPDADGYPGALALQEPRDADLAADVLVGALFGAAFLPHPAFDDGSGPSHEVYFRYDVTTPEEDRGRPASSETPAERGTLVGICCVRLEDPDGDVREALVFFDPFVPLKALACEDLNDLRRIHAAILEAGREGARGGEEAP